MGNLRAGHGYNNIFSPSSGRLLPTLKSETNQTVRTLFNLL